MLWVLAQATSGIVDPAKFTAGSVAQVLGMLLFIALLMERAVEVFVIAWRDADAAALHADLEELQKELLVVKSSNAAGKAKQVAKLGHSIADCEKKKINYKLDTQRKVLLASMTMGLLISAIGFRSLATLVDIRGLNEFQEKAFALIDIILTGGLIAGGSEGIHKITQVYTTFMATTAINNKKRAATPPAGQ